MPKHSLRLFGWATLTLIACASLALANPLPPAQTGKGTIPESGALLQVPRSRTHTSTLPEVMAPLQLPLPQTSGGRPLMQVLKDRHTSREFSKEKLSLQMLSNLLWAAFGINRPDSGKRTAPSCMNWQEIDIYVVTPDGAYLYDPKANALHSILTRDVRDATGGQGFVKDAPVDLVYVADLAKTGKAGPQDQLMYTAADTGFIAQNVYLFCASEGLATVVRGGVDRVALAKLMKLRPDQKIILAQTIGYPKK